MEHLNNDMDDLFSKAGELYPLRTAESDWDGVLSKLREEISRDQHIESGLNARGNRRKRRWLFLLFLIPIGLFSLYYFSGSEKLPTGNPDTATVHPDQASEKMSDKKSAAGEANPPAESHKLAETASNQESGLNRLNRIQLKNGSFAGQNGAVDEGNRNATYLDKGTVVGTGKKSGAADNGIAVIKPENPFAYSQAFANTDAEIFQGLKTRTLSLSVVSSSEMVLVHGKSFTATAGVSLKTTTGTSLKSKTEISPGSKGIYIGLLAGPDISSVDFQSIKHPGFSLGVLIGYRFNNRLALETGLLWDKKYYYSSGEYFNKSKTNIPPNVNIVNVDGNCNMFEIPLALRYDFISRSDHGFFVKAGLSSYLMKKENYDYLAETYGVQYQHSASYMNSTNNIFSILQLSGGYEHTLSGNTRIRIEPYLKIPIQGIGIGNMPISSAGFYIGISHSFR